MALRLGEYAPNFTADTTNCRPADDCRRVIAESKHGIARSGSPGCLDTIIARSITGSLTAGRPDVNSQKEPTP